MAFPLVNLTDSQTLTCIIIAFWGRGRSSVMFLKKLLSGLFQYRITYYTSMGNIKEFRNNFNYRQVLFLTSETKSLYKILLCPFNYNNFERERGREGGRSEPQTSCRLSNGYVIPCLPQVINGFQQIKWARLITGLHLGYHTHTNQYSNQYCRTVTVLK